MVVYREFIIEIKVWTRDSFRLNIRVVTHPSIRQTLTRVYYVLGTVQSKQSYLLKNLGSCEGDPDVCIDDDSV